MKANQKFVQADEAVSPVIGVILMVAITVVLAAVVFVLVSDLGEGGDASPQISFSKGQSSGNTVWTVTKITNGPVDHNEITATCGGGSAAARSVSSGALAAGQTFTCTGTTASLTVVHTPTDTLIYNS